MTRSIIVGSVLAVAAGLVLVGCVAAASIEGPKHKDGTEVSCDLPLEFHLRNRGGSDGAGLCVFASIKHSAIWQSAYPLDYLFEYMFTRPGGGYPEKVDRMIAGLCKQKNLPVPDYLQVTGSDLEILKLACKTGRLPAVTYGYSPTGRYGGRRIAHMVSLLHADEKNFVVLDNNYPKTYEWMSPAEFQGVYGGRSGWAVILLDSGPPPPPEN